MATTAEGRAVTEAHRKRQLNIRSSAIADLIAIWPLLNPLDLDSTFVAFVMLAMRLVGQNRAMSAQEAMAYYEQFRAVETGFVLPPPPVRVAALATEKLTTSLIATSVASIKANTAKGMTPEQAKTIALVQTSGAVARHTLDAGRDTIVRAVEADADAVGFARVTDADPCAFCAMLASRGFAYKSRQSALLVGRSNHRYHDGCGCTVEPSFGYDAQPPPGNDFFEQLWIESTSGLSGKDAMAAFRRALEDRRAS